MRAITLRNIHPDLQQFLEMKSREEGLSLNKTVLRILEEFVGLRLVTTDAHFLKVSQIVVDHYPV